MYLLDDLNEHRRADVSHTKRARRTETPTTVRYVHINHTPIGNIRLARRHNLCINCRKRTLLFDPLSRILRRCPDTRLREKQPARTAGGDLFTAYAYGPWYACFLAGSVHDITDVRNLPTPSRGTLQWPSMALTTSHRFQMHLSHPQNQDNRKNTGQGTVDIAPRSGHAVRPPSPRSARISPGRSAARDRTPVTGM
jgi:hypothetical protein